MTMDFMFILSFLKVVAMEAKLNETIFKSQPFLSRVGARGFRIPRNRQSKLSSSNLVSWFDSYLHPSILWCVKTMGIFMATDYWFL